MADQTTIKTHRTPAGMQVDPVGTDTTYTQTTTKSGGAAFGFLVGAGLAVIAILLAFLFLAGPEEDATVGSGGDVATESAAAPADDPETAPVEQPAATPDAAAEAEEPAPAGDTGTATAN